MGRLQISGLASGIDTGSLIDQMMSIERAPIAKLDMRKTQLNFKSEGIGELRTMLLSLDQRAKAITSLGVSAGKKGTVSDESILNASPSNDAITGRFDINVIKLAKPTILSKAITRNGENITSSDYMTLRLSQIDEFAFSGNTLTINDTDISFNALTDSLSTLIDRVNKSDAGVSMYFDSHSSSVVIMNKDGSTADIKFGGVDGAHLEFFGIPALVDSDPRLGNDSEISVNGSEPITFAGKNFSWNGISLNIKKEGLTSVNVQTDTSNIASAVKGLIDTYNSIVNFIHSKNREERVNDPKSISDLQRGALRNDPTFNRINSNLRNLMSSFVFGDESKAYRTLNQLGIEMDRTLGFSSMTGALKIDDSKLNGALAENSGEVIDFVTDLSSRIESLIANDVSFSGTLSTYNKSLTDQMKGIDTQKERIEAQISRKRSMLERQMTALEVNLSKIKSQGDWLGLQMASMFNN